VEMKPRMVGIVGSNRPHGNTEAAVRAALSGAAEGGLEIELIKLKDYRVEHCRGCYEAHQKPSGRCVIDDDMALLCGKLAQADALVIGSPVYFGGITGLLRVFMDRSGPLWGKLAGKPVGVITVGEDRFGGQELAGQEIAVFCAAHKMRLAAWPLALQSPPGDRPGSVANDADAVQKAQALGRSVAAALAG